MKDAQDMKREMQGIQFEIQKHARNIESHEAAICVARAAMQKAEAKADRVREEMAEIGAVPFKTAKIEEGQQAWT